MRLKDATVFVITALTIGLIIDATQWVIITFNLLPYQNNISLFRGVGLLLMLIKYIPLIIFFFVLYLNQKDN